MSELYVIEGHAETYQEALRLTGGKLFEMGCVTDEFADKCIERELEFPTGLVPEVPVAIPHAPNTYVKRQAICALRLDKPVKFHSMQDVESWVDCKYVLNLALLDDSEHIKIIVRVINSLKDPKFLEDMGRMSVEELHDFLDEHFFSDNEEE